MPDKLISILGAGNWGTTLAVMLAEKGLEVRLWEYRPEAARAIQQKRENSEFLPGIKLPDRVEATADLGWALQESPVVFWVLPSSVLRSVCKQAKPYLDGGVLQVSFIKGIEVASRLRPSQLLEQGLGAGIRLAVVSGPNIAPEIARRLPSATVAAASSRKDASQVQELLMSGHFRVYTSNDIIGVELGGALKNIIAIAAGIVDGLGMGANTKGALLTRGLAEITRLGVDLGARPETFAGLSGMGDMITTCFSSQSRNRSVGQQIAQGRSLPEIIAGLTMVAEGVETTRAAQQLAQDLGIEMPITEQMHQVLFQGKPPQDALRDLMGRQPREEIW